MFTTLQKLHTASTGGYTYPGFEVARLGTRENVKRFTEFFQNSHFAVASNHLLVKLIESVPIEHGNDVRKYFDSVTDVAYEIASAVGVCSPAYRGGVTNKPWLYGTGNTEIPVAINDYNKEELEFTAENQYGITEFPPLRLLTHPITSVGLDIPDGRTPATEKGLDALRGQGEWIAFAIDVVAHPVIIGDGDIAQGAPGKLVDAGPADQQAHSVSVLFVEHVVIAGIGRQAGLQFRAMAMSAGNIVFAEIASGGLGGVEQQEVAWVTADGIGHPAQHQCRRFAGSGWPDKDDRFDGAIRQPVHWLHHVRHQARIPQAAFAPRPVNMQVASGGISDRDSTRRAEDFSSRGEDGGGGH